MEDLGSIRSAPSISLGVRERLEDREFRTAFFLAEAGAQIAAQLIFLRKLRRVSQAKLAEEIDTKQSGISRVESADYGNWNFNTLRKIAAALDGRLRITIEPAEKVLAEYEDVPEVAPSLGSAALAGESRLTRQDLDLSIISANLGKNKDGIGYRRREQGRIVDQDATTGNSAVSA